MNRLFDVKRKLEKLENSMKKVEILHTTICTNYVQSCRITIAFDHIRRYNNLHICPCFCSAHNVTFS